MSSTSADSASRDPAGWWQWFTANLAAGQLRYSDALGDDLMTAARSGAIEATFVPAPALTLLGTIAAFAQAWKIAERADQTAARGAAARGEIAGAFASPLARFLLANFLLPFPQIEFMLTQARRALLDRAAEDSTASDTERNFAAALALQCALNEYAYGEEADEGVLVDALEAKIGAKPSESAFALSVVACYRPLVPSSVLTVESLTRVTSPDAGFQEMATRLIGERLYERALRDTFPTLTPINDAVSVAVRAHYEEHPYPSWRLPVLVPMQPTSAAVRQWFPAADFQRFGDVTMPRILIAGCGTGLPTASIAKLFACADITAIDLSRASLAYARRQLDTLGLYVTFAQADILALDASKLQFDIIECGGVLHHTGDPLRSWRVLTACLRPGGLMHVSLYNKNERAWINAPREFARKGGYPATDTGIRRFRQDLLRAVAQGDQTLAETLERPDFYSLSLCRDTFFHTQECEYGIREVLAMVDELGLDFLGLRLPSSAARAAYLERHPGDPSIKNADDIEAEEGRQKDFAGLMYSLHLQKPL